MRHPVGEHDVADAALLGQLHRTISASRVSSPTAVTSTPSGTARLGCGVIFAAVGYAITLGLWWAGLVYLVLPMVCGFIIVGPLMAVGAIRDQPAAPRR